MSGRHARGARHGERSALFGTPRAQGLELVDEGVALRARSWMRCRADGRLSLRELSWRAGDGRQTARGAGDLRAGERQARIGYRLEHAAIRSRPDYYD